uniref:Uncharacterized protein n=1 Tax=Callorhinchus milii TaxID=7868 RepID=A0A4W3GJX5_CALMI
LLSLSVSVCLSVSFSVSLSVSVDGVWTPWGAWSVCDRSCGGGKAVRTRACSDPPPKNGGSACGGERYEVMLCNTEPCGADVCPAGLERAECATRCPRSCADLQ